MSLEGHEKMVRYNSKSERGIMQNKVLIVRASGLVGTAAAISFARADWPVAAASPLSRFFLQRRLTGSASETLVAECDKVISMT